MQKWNAERGMSLVEATIILMVLAILTSVIAPSVGDYIEEARNTKAKEDVEAIGTALARITRDTGLGCLVTGTVANGCDKDTRADLLHTAAGNIPTVDTAVAADVGLPAGSAADVTALNWLASTFPAGNVDTFDDQFVANVPAYAAVSFTAGGGPKSKLGWRGAYLTGPISADPWGNVYYANSIFLGVANDTGGATTATEGLMAGGWSHDVVVISAGNNATIQTPFLVAATTALSAGGDDVIYTVQNATR